MCPFDGIVLECYQDGCAMFVYPHPSACRISIHYYSVFDGARINSIWLIRGASKQLLRQLLVTVEA